MLKKYLEAGKIVGTHGVKGMLRVQFWCDTADFLRQFKTVYTDKNGEHKLTVKSVAPHGNVVLMAIDGIDTVEKAESLRGKVLFIDRNDANLPDGRYFIDDLLGCTVFDADSGAVLGTLSDVSETGANDVWHIKNGEKEYLVPVIADVVVEVNPEDEKITIRPLKGIFDDEN